MFNGGIINNGGPNLSGGGGGGGGGVWWWWVAAPPHSRTAVAVTAVAGIAVFAALYFSTNRGNLKSPWSQRKRKGALSPQEWRSFFTPEGRLLDGGVKFLKKVRSGGIDPSIRAEVWPFLLGVYDLSSTKEEREVIRTQKRKEYEKLRKKCECLCKYSEGSKLYDLNGATNDDDGGLVQDVDSSDHKDGISSRGSSTNNEMDPDVEYFNDSSSTLVNGVKCSRQVADSVDSTLNTPSSDAESSNHPEVIQASSTSKGQDENDHDVQSQASLPASSTDSPIKCSSENFATWQRIIRVDAVRANAEWMPFSPSQAAVTESQAQRLAEAVGLKAYDHLEPSRIFHAARLVAILEAYAVYDPEIGYCQGMSDLLSPIITIITEDYEAFCCFVGFMKKARHNFRLDEVGIRRQLNIVSRIIKFKDSRLYGHLEKLQAEDCFFVYRMVVVLFRRELTFEQTVCLWEVIWADQAAIRASIGKSAWSTIRQRVPLTDDLLLYAIAASVLQRRKTIIEKYSSMDEILRECNSMAGHLDVWKLLDDAHSLVVNLHDKIETSLQ